MPPTRRLRCVALLVSVTTLVACNDSPTETAEVGAPAALDIVAGDAQEGVVGTELANPLVIRVEDSNGLPVIGQLVNFRVTAGGGSVFAGSGITNAQGIVQDRWTLGTSTADSQRVEARAVDPNTGARIVFATFRATAQPGPAQSVNKVGGDGQHGPLGVALAESLAVRVADAFGNPVRGVTVTWGAGPGNGAVSPATSATNAQGVAKAAWTLGSRLELPQAATAAVTALPPATFNATGTLPSSAAIVKIAGDGASAIVGTPMAESLAVRVQLANGQPVAGARVTWAVFDGGGSVSPETSITGEDGIARARLTPGTTPRANTVTASVMNLTPVMISVMAQADVPASVTKISGDDQAALAGHRLSSPVVVRVTDRFGNQLAGVTVAWAVTGGGGSVSPSTSTTDVSGRASAQWTVGSAGTQSLSATVAGVTPVSFVALAFGPASPVRSALALGHRHTCAISDGGATYCWGANEDGQLGDGTTTTRLTPTAVSGSPQFSAIASGGNHTCALSQDGTAYCWGLNDHGQLGDGTTAKRPAPTAVTGPVRFVVLTLGYRHTCGLTSIGRVYCWGYNAEGEVGDGTSADRLVPTPVTGGLTFESIASGFWFTCGLVGNSVYCWGKSIGAELVGGTPINRHSPAPLASGQAFTFVEAGGNHACGLAGGSAYCWGSGNFGERGGSDATAGVPVQVEGNPSFASLAAGDAFTCGLTTSGVVYCWGINHAGELGRGTMNTSENPTPVAVTGGLQFLSHGAGIGRYSCGRAAPSSGLYCWGMNFDGQLGDGTTTHRSVPWPVVIP